MDNRPQRAPTRKRRLRLLTFFPLPQPYCPPTPVIFIDYLSMISALGYILIAHPDPASPL